MARRRQKRGFLLAHASRAAQAFPGTWQMIAIAALGGFVALTMVASAHAASGYLKPDVDEKALKKAEKRFGDGVELYQERNYRAALRKFMSAENACPELFSAGYHVALAHRKMGNEDAAVAQLKKLNARFPENIIAYNDLGVIYAGKDKKEFEALAYRELETAISNGGNLLLGEEKNIAQVRVDLAVAYGNLGALQFKNARLAEAEKSFRKATEHYPRAFFGHFGLGNVLFAMKGFSEAKAAYRRAQQIEPNNMHVHIALARCYLSERDKNPRFALSELRKINVEKRPPEVYELFGDAYALLDRREEAIGYYKRHLGLPGRNPRVLYKLGALYYNIRDSAQAKKYLEEFVEKAPEDEEGALPLAYKLLGDIAREEKDYQQAVAYYGQATRLRDDYFSSYYGLAESLVHLEKNKEAREYLRLLLDRLPKDGSSEEKELRQKASALLERIPPEK